MADFNFNGYPNFVLENKIKSILSTKLDINRFLTADYSLEGTPGLTKKIHTYTGTGNAEVLARGDGNSSYIDAGYVEQEYTAVRTQGQARWYDDDEMSDPALIDAKMQSVSESMVNAWTAAAIAEYSKSLRTLACDFSTTANNYLFNLFADALAEFPEEEEDIFALINPKNKAWVRKALADDLKYVEAFVRTGYIGTVCGVPIYESKAVLEDSIYIGKKEAVKAFIKTGVRVERDRDIDTKKNIVVADRYAIIALVDNSKLLMLAKAQSTACAITTYTKNAKTIAGTCGTDCFLVHVVDGDGEEYDVVPSSGAWTMTAKANLTAGEKINATAFAAGKAAKVATEVTVAS